VVLGSQMVMAAVSAWVLLVSFDLFFALALRIIDATRLGIV
jgi:hypothetical protein